MTRMKQGAGRGGGGNPCFRSFLDESNGWPGLKPGDLRPNQPFDLDSIMTSSGNHYLSLPGWVL